MKIKIILLLLFSGLFLLQGCCLIGLGIGAIYDANKPDSVVVSLNDLPTLQPGQELAIQLTAGQKVRGKFEGYGRFPSYAYKAKYYGFIKALQKENRLPALGTNLIVKTRDKKFLTGRHVGFDSKTLYLLDRKQRIIPVKLATIVSLSGKKGQNYTIKAIASLGAKSNFPVFSQEKIDVQPKLLMYTSSAHKTLSLNEIEHVVYYPRKNAKLKGFIIGGTMDTIGLIWIMNQPAPVGTIDLGPMY